MVMLDSNFEIIVNTPEMSEGSNEFFMKDGGFEGCPLAYEGIDEAIDKNGGWDGS